MSNCKQTVTGAPLHAAIVFALAAFVRTVYWFSYFRSPLAGHFQADHKFYRDWGLLISQGTSVGEEAFVQGPLYAYLLGGWFALFNQAGALLLFVQILVGSTTCLLVYLSALQLFGSRIAFISGILCAIYGPLVFYDCMVMKSFLSPFFTMIVLYCGVRYSANQNVSWLIVIGVSTGLAGLIRENHLLFLIPAGLLVWQTNPANPTLMKTRIFHSLCLAAGCALIIVPVATRNTKLAGELVIVTTGGGEVFYMAQGPDANGYYSPPAFVRPDPVYEHEDFRAEARRRTNKPQLSVAQCSRYWYQEGLKNILTDPLRFVRLTFKKFLILLNDFEVPDSENYLVAKEFILPLRYLPSFGWFCGIGILGLVVSLRDWKRLILPLGLLLAHVISVLLIYNFARFRIGMMPLWLIFSAVGIDWLWKSWTTRSSSQMKRGVGTIAVIIVSAASFMSITDKMTADFKRSNEIYRQLLQARQRTQHEVQLTSERLQNNPENLTAGLQHAIGLMQLGQFQEAAEVLERVVQNHPQSAEAHRFLGAAYGQTQEWEQAIDHLNTASKLEPFNPDTLSNLGTAYAEAARHQSDSDSAARFKKAVKSWQRALEQSPQHSMSRYNLARHWMRMNDYTRAIQELDQLTQSDPNFRLAESLLESLALLQAPTLSNEQFLIVAMSLERLSIAYAQSGHVAETLHAAKLALTAAEKSGNREFINRLKQHKQNVP